MEHSVVVTVVVTWSCQMLKKLLSRFCFFQRKVLNFEVLFSQIHHFEFTFNFTRATKKKKLK